MSDVLFANGAAWFTVPAMFGTGVFVIRLVLMLVGGHGDIGLDHGGGGHGGGHGGHHGAHGDADGEGDSGYAFEVLSFQSICAFLMGFGWGGLAALRGSHFGWPASLATGCVGGVGMLWLLALMLKAMSDLQSSGNISLSAALGIEGDVYVGVPAQGRGRGQVRVVIDQRERMYNAISDGEELPTRSRVRVVRVNDDNTVTVAPA